ncbi:MAG: hypothetical protein J6V08_01235 [Candidatus Methanomethylophilaceae archaeon]|nr:hypothetical protein [Candidatus Methanomethylophilaceae archaeon]
MTVCGRCRKAFNPWNCPECNSRLENDKEGMLYCTSCDHKHLYGFLVCPNCKHEMEGYAWKETQESRFRRGQRN